MRHIKTISEFHRFRQLGQPEHPLFSLIDVGNVGHLNSIEPTNLVLDFYFIALKSVSNFKAKYGQQECDFSNGIMSFMSPNQVFNIYMDNNEELKQKGWVILIHPDFFWNTSLAKSIKHYDFFDYSVNEALFISEKEESTLYEIIKNISQEYHSNIDKFSKKIIISHIESLLNYAERFYNRQFITRDKINHQVLDRMERILSDYFNSDELVSKGLPTVQYISERLYVSQSYLGNLLRALTGQSTQQHIHDKLIKKAKEKLSTTELSISEIAYELGFEHSQSFSKIFKTKTSLTPSAFRRSFN